MESQTLNQQQEPQSLSPSSSGRRTSHCCNSPEFEFWMLRNPSFPQPDLHSADELFADGVLLPLHLLKSDPPHQTPDSEPPVQDLDSEPGPVPEPEPSPAITDSSPSTFTSSKRWKDIFKKKTVENNTEEKEKGSKKKERKGSTGGTSSAELNINIWPFSRSRSAGNATIRPKLFLGVPVTRKVNSAPCSRSNSAGENKSRKWPSSPGRAGVHVGRSSPVWQVRPTKNTDTEKGSKKETTTTTKTNPTIRRSKVAGGTGKAKVLNLNVPMCIGYRHHLSCRSDEKSAIGVSARGSGNNNSGSNCNNNNNNDNNGGSGGNLFNLRNLFTKKGILTSH